MLTVCHQVPLNPAFKTAQITGALNHVTAKCLIISTEANMPSGKAPVSNLPIVQSFVDNLDAENITSTTVPSLEYIICVDNSYGRIDPSAAKSLTPWYTFIKCDHPLHDNDVDHEDVAMIQFSSGTTAAPKGACLTHHNVLNSAYFTGSQLGYTERDIICCPTPLLHVFGSLIGLATAQLFGATLVLPAEAFNAAATVHALRTERCTSLYGVPAMYIAILQCIKDKSIHNEEFQHLRTGMIAGAQIYAPLLRELYSVLSIPELAVSWGMSELSGAATVSRPYDSLDKKIQTVGAPLPNARVRVVSRDDPLKELPVGHRGELVIAGNLLMKGYWNDDAATAAAQIRDSATGVLWMRSGDEGTIDDEGYISVTGRIKDVIIRGGENIYPMEIESILLEHPLVVDASVIGLPDEKLGEAVGAFVVVASAVEKEELIERISHKLGRFWVPTKIFFVSELPTTASGKIQKFELRQKASTLLSPATGSICD